MFDKKSIENRHDFILVCKYKNFFCFDFSFCVVISFLLVHFCCQSIKNVFYRSKTCGFEWNYTRPS